MGWFEGWFDGLIVGLSDDFNKNAMEKKYMKLTDVDAYKTAFHLSNYVWKIVITWDWFSKKTIGAQFVEAVDSISANIAEGFGRYHKKDKVKFYRYSQASQKESLDWNEKSKNRNLLTESQYRFIFEQLKKIAPETGSLIKYTNEKLKI